MTYIPHASRPYQTVPPFNTGQTEGEVRIPTDAAHLSLHGHTVDSSASTQMPANGIRQQWRGQQLNALRNLQFQGGLNDRSTPAASEEVLVKRYASDLKGRLLGGNGKIDVPKHTVLGQWLAFYQTQLEQPVVQRWMREQKIDPATVSLTPETGVLTANVEGVLKRFTLTDGSGWRQIADPLLAAAQVIIPTAGQPLQVSFEHQSLTVPMDVVGDFYGENPGNDEVRIKQAIWRLEKNLTFSPLSAQDPLRAAYPRSPQALAAQRASAEAFYAAAPEKLAFSRLASAVAQAYPNPKTLAKELAEKIVKDHAPDHKEVDADNLHFLRFYGGVSEPGARSGWEHPNEEPYYSKTLTEAVLSNFAEREWLPGEADANGGIYTQGPGQSKKSGYGAHNEFPLAPSVFMKSVWNADVQSLMTEKIDAYWKAHADDYRTVQKGEFVNQARAQFKQFDALSDADQASLADEHKFTWDDYRLVMGAASNVPVIEHEPITVAQLQVETPVYGRLRAHVFDINDQPSDIIRFSEQDDPQERNGYAGKKGKQILYIPGANPAFLRFDTLEKMDAWVVEQAKDPQKRKDLASHFSLYSRQDGATFLGRTGVDASLAKLASGNWARTEGDTIDSKNHRINGDIFSALRDFARARMTRDADTVIKSNSEVTRDTWLNDVAVGAGLLAKMAPLGWPAAAAAVGAGVAEIALGAENAASGDTQAERKDGAWKIFDGTLNTLFSAASSGPVDDPFAPPAAVVTQEIDAVEQPTKTLTDSYVGDWLGRWLAPSSPVDDVGSAYKDMLKRARETDTAAFNRGRNTGNPADIAGYSPAMSISQLKSLAVEINRTPEKVGSLARRINFLEELPDRFKVAQDQALAADPEAYGRGYSLADPATVEGYSSNLNLNQVKELAVSGRLTPEQTGTLVRLLEKQRIEISQKNFAIFSREVTASGGKVVAMPQGFYLSQANLLSEGECAALANAMALAIQEGREGALIENFYTAISRPELPASIAFRDSLTRFQGILENNLFGSRIPQEAPHQTIISRLGRLAEETQAELSRMERSDPARANARVSKALVIRDKGHALVAGVRFENQVKQYFYYDPNFGLVTFDTQQAMEKGLDVALKSGRASSLLDPYNTRAAPHYKYSAFDELELMQATGDIHSLSRLFNRLI